MTSAKHLRALLNKPEILVVPGGGSPLELRLISQAGFSAAYLSGYATSATRFGVPDIGLMGFGEVESTVLACTRVMDIPLIVDCDTGYGDVINVQATVRAMERMGAAAVQLEDQAWPKRCGHMDNKVVEPREVAIRKLKAAVAARTNPDMVIIARTDARGPLGLDEAISRCKAFHDNGADVVFVDGPESLDDMDRIGRESPGFVMANMSETGKTPMLTTRELEQLGFDLVIYPTSTLRVSIHAMSTFLNDLKSSGHSNDWISRMASLAQTNHILGMDEIRQFEADVLAQSSRYIDKQ